MPAFHGYSFTGNASAEYVYVGRGQQVDFARLKALGVPLEGKIALSKYGGPFRGLKVKNAQENGMIGCVIFTDPGDDGNVTEAKGYIGKARETLFCFTKHQFSGVVLDISTSKRPKTCRHRLVFDLAL